MTLRAVLAVVLQVVAPMIDGSKGRDQISTPEVYFNSTHSGGGLGLVGRRRPF